MILTTTTQTIKIVLAAAKATTDCPVTIDYVDLTSTDTTGGIQLANTNGSTPVTILSAPGASTQRKINLLTLTNNDTASITATIYLDDNGTGYNLLTSIVVPINAILQYTDQDGWHLTDEAGGYKDLRTGWVQEFTANGTWYKALGCRFYMVECVGGGGGGGGGQGNSSNAAIRAGGGGGGGGKRNRALFLAKDLPDSVSVVVGGTASGGTGGTNAAGNNGIGGNTSSFGTYLYGYAGGGGAGGNGSSGSGAGGGGGAISSGSSSTDLNGGLGGSAFIAGVATDTPNANGTSGSSLGLFGRNSYWGGAGGSGGQDSTTSVRAAGSSFFSAGGGGGGAGIPASASPNTVNGGQGGTTGATANTAGGGTGRTLSGYCGEGGSGGRNNGIFGINGGFPGGGGGGGGAGTIGGDGGTGAAGVVRIWGW